MPGVYRDDREATQARVADLETKLVQHRVRVVELSEMRDAATSLSKPRRGASAVLMAVIGSCLGAAFGETLGSSVDALVIGVGVGLAFAAGALLVKNHGDEPDLTLGYEEPAQREIRLRAVEAVNAHAELDVTQRRALEEEQRVCRALEEEIAEMRRALCGRRT
ncbi:MAG: hypothetical protein ABI461_23845 [Polyangiaceae bacterium]